MNRNFPRNYKNKRQSDVVRIAWYRRRQDYNLKLKLLTHEVHNQDVLDFERVSDIVLLKFWQIRLVDTREMAEDDFVQPLHIDYWFAMITSLFNFFAFRSRHE